MSIVHLKNLFTDLLRIDQSTPATLSAPLMRLSMSKCGLPRASKGLQTTRKRCTGSNGRHKTVINFVITHNTLSNSVTNGVFAMCCQRRSAACLSCSSAISLRWIASAVRVPFPGKRQTLFCHPRETTQRHCFLNNVLKSFLQECTCAHIRTCTS